MTITDDYIIFADKYHNKQHLPDDIIKLIMDINTKKEKQYKKAHKLKFNLVIDEIDEFRSFFNNDCINNMTYDKAVNFVNTADYLEEADVMCDNYMDCVVGFIADHGTHNKVNYDWYNKGTNDYGDPRWLNYFSIYNYLFYILAVTDKNYVF